jgi:CheY-like chemotaxis protein
MTNRRQEPSRPDGPRTGLRVLLVEDYPDCAETTALLLRMYGHEVELARDGSTALRILQGYRPDVVLLDIGLPGEMNGWELAERIKEQADERPPLLIAMSGFGREDDCRHSTASGIALHLLKPVDPRLLQAVLRQWQVHGVVAGFCPSHEGACR